ncbi:tetratricopeptide repeat (TPR)-containing protein [Striga asiatica]|uniref:Tetratricopeptide repeat (TPR)-containing protein n=1 Tax=Striga asiatica TaxID=4170 RepID=A0A5A7REB9_STRAF|nr:tetratricopeptide repeat (TPR)-containing protein [Striga asiatica]
MIEHGDAIPKMDSNTSDSRLVPEETLIFDASEHPQELEHESGLNLQEEDEDKGDADYSEASEEEEEETELDDKSEYKFQFQGEMDPLSFAEEKDASGLQPYERFERIEYDYEVLAVKKRPASQETLSEVPSKRLRQDEVLGASFEEIMETMNYGMRRRSRKNKKSGRRKGSRNKVKPEVSRKLGDATLHYAHGRFEEAICLLKEVILVAPNLSDPYHTLGLIYTAMGDKKKALNFYMIAAHLTPKDCSLWKLLVAQSIEQGDKRQANYCLNKAIIADPHDIGLRLHRASLYIELGDCFKAADSYEQISRHCPDNIEVLEKATQVISFNMSLSSNALHFYCMLLYKKCGQHERTVSMLEDSLRNHDNHANLRVVDLLSSVLMENNAYAKALEHIERAQQGCVDEKEIPLHVIIKAGICHVQLGHMEKAEFIGIKSIYLVSVVNECAHVLIYAVILAHLALEELQNILHFHYRTFILVAHQIVSQVCFSEVKPENSFTHPHLVIDIADSLMTAGCCESALKYYMMLEEDAEKYNGYLHLKIARCYASLKNGVLAIEYYYKAVKKLADSVDARLVLACLLVEEGRDDEAISVLSPPVESVLDVDRNSVTCKVWWDNGKIKLKLAQIYKAKGSAESFADVLFPVIREMLFIETMQQKVKARRRLSRSVLSERVKVLDYQQTDNVFHGFRPVASSADLSKASRAKRLLEKKAAMREVQKAAALAAGIDWRSDDSDDESPQVVQESPLPDFLKEEENHLLIVDLCKSLSVLRRYWDALEIINICLKLESNTLSAQIKEELRTLGAQVSYNISDPLHGWECVRYLVSRHPYSFSAWSCYYKGILRYNNLSKRNKFLHSMRVKHKDSIPPIVISAHRFTMISQHQAAAREYLEAHKLMPDNTLINLCAGSQESMYNIARAYHHVGLISLAATYYEKVLAVREKDYPIPRLPNDNQDSDDAKNPGYCDLRREAAYNLHLIYKKSGAFDLARQVLKDHVVL